MRYIKSINIVMFLSVSKLTKNVSVKPLEPIDPSNSQNRLHYLSINFFDTEMSQSA